MKAEYVRQQPPRPQFSLRVEVGSGRLRLWDAALSDYNVLQTTSLALRDLLWADFQNDSQINPQFINSPDAIEFTNPAEIKQNDSLRLSLWLYQITENEFVKNQPAVRTNLGDMFPPMALNLYYLVTPNSTRPESNHLILGKTMQILYDNASVAVRLPGVAVYDLRIIFARLSLEELTRIWEALKEPYRLSVCYQVRVALIDSLRLDGSQRVLERRLDFGASQKIPEMFLDE